jgi:glycosyltransferase involved in cell wall biosynthesis
VKILVTSTFVTPFIAQDLDLLRKHFEVAHLLVRGFSAPLAIAAAVRKAGLVYTWFASTYAAAAVFSARRRGIPSMIALGGADVAAVPELGYGIWTSPWRSRLVGYALRNAGRVLAVDPYLKDQAARRAGYDGRNIETLPTGYDPEAWSPGGAKDQLILTVAVCDSAARLKIKGIDLLFETAARLPAVPFVLVGIHDRLVAGLRGRAPANVDVRGRVGKADLLGLYRRAKVYCQPSVIEGLPGAVCEAMLCGCFPVGTDVGGMRSAINGAGLLVPYGDSAGLAGALRNGLASGPEASAAARSAIAGRFTLSRREDGLVNAINELLA